MDNADIVFDSASGFSEAEQREILAGIEAATRKEPIATAPDKQNLGAKKRGVTFPFFVNLGGLVLLAGGILALSFFYRQDESDIREGTLNSTDRRLIQEIRRENEARIHEKEREISDILAKLSGLDGDLQSLQSSLERRVTEREAELRERMNRELDEERERLANQNLSETAITERMRIFDEQRIARMNAELAAYREQLDAERYAAELNLQKLQEDYRNNLTGLQAERAGILEASRLSEANLKAQLEAKAGEITQRYEQNQEALNLAREELRRLADEQERSVLVERQMGGFYTLAREYIREGSPEDAMETLSLMREFLETPAFQTVRAIQTQKESHLAAIDTLSVAVEGLLRGAIPLAPPDPRKEEDILILKEENAALSQTITDQTREIEAYRSQGTALTRTMREFEGTITTLRTQTAAQERDIGVLRSENAAQVQRISTQERDLIALRNENTAQAQRISSQERDISALRTQNTAQAQTISAHERDISALRSQNAAQAQTIADQTQQITTLRSTNTSLHQAMENLQKAVDSARELLQTQGQQ